MSVELSKVREKEVQTFDSSEFILYEDDGSLTFTGHTTHLIDPDTGRQYLRLEDTDSTPYPEPTRDEILDDLVLPLKHDANGVRYACLPSGFSTLKQMIEDLTANDMFTIDSFIEDGVLDEMRALFTQIGDQLNYLADGDNKVVTSLEARQILVVPMDEEKNGPIAVLLLPPLNVTDPESGLGAELQRSSLLRNLYGSLFYTAQSKLVKDVLPAAFKGFTDAYTFGKSEDVDVTESDLIVGEAS